MPLRFLIYEYMKYKYKSYACFAHNIRFKNTIYIHNTQIFNLNYMHEVNLSNQI